MACSFYRDSIYPTWFFLGLAWQIGLSTAEHPGQDQRGLSRPTCLDGQLVGHQVH